MITKSITHLSILILLSLVLGAVIPQLSPAAPLDEALELVMSKSAAVQAKNRVMGVVGAASDLTGKISLASGYADKPTQDFAGGFDYRARFQVEYPLFGGTAKSQNDQDKARAISELYIAEEQLRAQFIQAVHSIAELERSARSLIQEHALKVDRLKYTLQINEKASEGERIDPWPFIEAAKQAENTAFQADQKFLITLETVSRTYGKDEWERLRQLMVAHVKSTGQPLDSQTQSTVQKSTQPEANEQSTPSALDAEEQP